MSGLLRAPYRTWSVSVVIWMGQAASVFHRNVTTHSQMRENIGWVFWKVKFRARCQWTGWVLNERHPVTRCVLTVPALTVSPHLLGLDAETFHLPEVLPAVKGTTGTQTQV